MMKKLIFAILFFASVCYAAAPTASSIGMEIWEYDLVDTITAAYDTITADGDSSILFADFVPEKGWHYILARSVLTGTGTDSLVLRILLRPEDWNDVPICSVYVDSFTTAAGEYMEIPFHIYPAKQYDLIVEGDGAVGTQCILNRMMLFKIRAFLTTGKNKQ